MGWGSSGWLWIKPRHPKVGSHVAQSWQTRWDQMEEPGVEGSFCGKCILLWVEMQQLALRKTQNFILRAGNSGSGHHLDKIQIYRGEALDWGIVHLYHTHCSHSVLFGKCYCRVWQNVFGFDLPLLWNHKPPFSEWGQMYWWSIDIFEYHEQFLFGGL